MDDFGRFWLFKRKTRNCIMNPLKEIYEELFRYLTQTHDGLIMLNKPGFKEHFALTYEELKSTIELPENVIAMLKIKGVIIEPIIEPKV